MIIFTQENNFILNFQGRMNVTVQDSYLKKFIIGSGFVYHVIDCCMYKG